MKTQELIKLLEKNKCRLLRNGSPATVYRADVKVSLRRKYLVRYFYLL